MRIISRRAQSVSVFPVPAVWAVKIMCFLAIHPSTSSSYGLGEERPRRSPVLGSGFAGLDHPISLCIHSDLLRLIQPDCPGEESVE